MNETVAILFSGGTDSTCAAALMTERFSHIHLLTFDRYGFHHVERSRQGAERLFHKFPQTTFEHKIIKIDKLFSRVAFDGYLSRLRKFGFMMLQNCTFCALTNHFRALDYCLENQVTTVADGVTRELQFLPSHMEKPIERMRAMYAEYGIEYLTPVYDFDIPRDVNFFDKLTFSEDGNRGVEVAAGLKTTGRHLHDLGLLPSENIKGSALDRRLQYRCFQYVLHNMVAHCALPGSSDYPRYEREILTLYEDAIARFKPDAPAAASQSPPEDAAVAPSPPPPDLDRSSQPSVRPRAQHSPG